MRIIGLTGGIGSGKSTVSAYMREKGYTVLDADKIAREIVEPGSAILVRLTEAFGASILQQDGTLNRKELGSIVFSDTRKREILEKITHPAILKMIEDTVSRFQGDAIVIDAPLLFETGLDRIATEIWVVETTEDVLLQRVEKRDGLTCEDVKKRMAVQLSVEEKREKADRILNNSGTREELYYQVDELIGDMK